MFRFKSYPLFWALLAVIVSYTQAQTTPARITEAVNESRLVILKGNTHPLALPQYDRGAAPPSLPMRRMQLVLTRAQQQETTLHNLLDAQQDGSSPSFHKWLTPEEFGRQFGPADQDVQVVSAWLQSQGFQINHVAKGKSVIEFSGTANSVRNAFHTDIHKFVINGEEHWANIRDPQIPQALAPVVAGIAALHNFKLRPQYTISGKWPKVPLKGGGYRPAYNDGDVGRALAPADFATIYNIAPLYKEGLNGSGVTIGIVGEMPFLLQDIVDFRNVFDLPQNLPQMVVNGTSPDYFQFEPDFSDENVVEATLDVSWSGAIAPSAAIKFLIAADTDTTDSVTLSEEYAIDNNDVDILSESFGGCESFAGAAAAQLVNAMREQAAAQGITWIVSSGDTGPYGCQRQELTDTIGPISPNVLATSPYVVAVGGTEFTSASIIGTTYWSATNNKDNLGSATSYPPEEVWNDSCDAAQCGEANVAIASSGGGVSQFFTKPSWQSSVGGIPADGARDVPDLSFSASDVNAPYLICLGGSCEGTISSNSFTPIGGTSCGTPALAGVMALINQKLKSRQGAVNYMLYRLAAAEQYGNCNGSNTKAAPQGSCIFNDITTGDSSIPGEPNYGKATALYPATTGYDLTTGLGSVNVANLANKWGPVGSSATNTSFTLNPASFAHGTAANFQASVAAESGGGTPTGSVAVELATGAGYGAFALSSGTATSNVTSLPGGSYSVHAHYSGDSTYAPSDSAGVPITVTPEASTVTAGALYEADIPYSLYTGGPYGNVSLALSARVAGVSGQGTATGKVSFSDNGQPVSGGNGVLNTEAQGLSFNTNIVFPVGKHSIVAGYAGDASFQPSVSQPVVLTITQAPTITDVQTSVGEAQTGKAVILMATVESGISQFGNTETGTVTFYVNGKPFGTRFLGSNIDFNTGYQNAVVELHTASLPQGTNTVTAVYNGDSNYIGSTSAPTTISIKPQAPACLVTNFTADPSYITLYDPPNTTSITATAECSVDLRVGSPSGTLLDSGKGTLFATATINATTTFYLQQTGVTTSQGTLQTLTVGVQTGALPCTVLTFGATPNPIISSTLMGSTTITAVAVNAAGACNFDVRQGAPNGKLLGTSFEGIFVATTNDTVTNGTQFFMQPQGDIKAQDTLATLTVSVQAAAPAAP